MTIEDIRGLVGLEKDSEEKIRRAKEEADTIIKKSEEDALRILQSAEDQKYYDAVFATGSREIHEKKKLIERETEEKIERIRKTGKKNLERTISFIARRVLEE
jgi:vacuolar-type H+-ATPase subunit H